MYSKILVPLDGSPLAETSIRHIAIMVKDSPSSAVVLFRSTDPIDAGVRQRLSAELAHQLETAYLSEATQYLEQMKIRLREMGINATTAIATGPAGESILEYCADNEIDLIVMSSHGRTGLARWAFGSITEKVLKQSDIPILVIPHRGAQE